MDIFMWPMTINTNVNITSITIELQNPETMIMFHDYNQNCDILAVLCCYNVFIYLLFSVTRRLRRLWSYQTRGYFIHKPRWVPSITNHQVPVTIPGRPLLPTCQLSSFDWPPPSHISQVRFQRIKTISIRQKYMLVRKEKKCGLIVIGCTQWSVPGSKAAPPLNLAAHR